ncbi:MAG: ABC transporter ATP-binding protein [Sandaracinaceae bacterium]
MSEGGRPVRGEGPVLEMIGVRKSYGVEVEVEVLHGIDLVVGHGELVALIGPSGSGKSTLLNLIGLLDRPSGGTLRILGEDVSTADDEARTRLRARALGFVFQFHHLIPALTAEENVRLPLAIARGRMSETDVERALSLLGDVGLRDRAKAFPRQLSGGQQQRVAIARALAHDPPLVLADEPTGNLDTETAEGVFELFRRFHRERGTAFLVVTHDPRIAKRCDRVISLLDGRVVSGSLSVA